MRVISLFSGCGGLDLGFKQAQLKKFFFQHKVLSLPIKNKIPNYKSVVLYSEKKGR